MSRGAYGTRGPKSSPTTLGARLKSIRLYFGWSQKAMSGLLGVAQQSVSNWEKDVAPPLGAAQAHLSRLLGLPWEALETGIGFQVPDQPPAGNLPGEVLVATEESSKSPVLLPVAAEGEGWVVEVGSENRIPLDPKAALKEIKRALEAGGNVWVVVKPKVKTASSASKPKKKG